MDTPLTKALKGIVKQIRRYNDAKNESRPIPEHETDGNKSEKRSVIVNTILTAFTLIAIAMTYQANKTSHDTLEYTKAKDHENDSLQIIKDSVTKKMMDSSLAISAKSAEFYRQSVMMTTRAYIIPDSIKPKRFGFDENPIIKFCFKNIGKTPAYKCSYRIRMFFSADRSVDSMWRTTKDATISEGDSYIGGEQIGCYTYFSPGKFTKNMMPNIEKYDMKLYFGIEVKYEDIYKQPHHTNMLTSIDKYGAMYAYKKFNDAD